MPDPQPVPLKLTGNRERAWQKRQKTRRDIQRRTRRSASIIGRAAAHRAEARPVPHFAKTRRNVPRRIAPANQGRLLTLDILDILASEA